MAKKIIGAIGSVAGSIIGVKKKAAAAPEAAPATKTGPVVKQLDRNKLGGASPVQALRDRLAGGSGTILRDTLGGN